MKDLDGVLLTDAFSFAWAQPAARVLMERNCRPE